MFKRVIPVLAMVALAACGGQQAPATYAQEESPLRADLKPDGKGHLPRQQRHSSGGGKNSGNGIYYHGGPLILGTTNVYYIWYGAWSGDSALSILPDFASNVGGSPYFNINTTYTDGQGRRVTNAVAYAGATADAYSHGTRLTDAQVQSVVAGALTSGALPADPNGVYFVLTSPDVAETSGFCSQYCAWHTDAAIGGVNIKYGFIGDPARCPSACEAPTTVSPNDNPGADGMVDSIAHELEESVTDPDLNAWYDRHGEENADKCAWTYGATQTLSNGSVANMTLGDRAYLIQRNWVNASGGYCALSYP